MTADDRKDGPGRPSSDETVDRDRNRRTPAAPSPPPAGRKDGWRPDARWKNQPPIPPDELRKKQRTRRMRSDHGAGALARFFTKQVLWFILLVFILLMVDVLLYILIATYEMDRSYLYGTPATITRQTSEQLIFEDGGYTLGDEAAAQLDDQHAWAQLVDAEGTVVWSYGIPQESAEAEEGATAPDTAGTDLAASDAASDEAAQTDGASSVISDDGYPIPDEYSLNDIALIAHYHSVKGQPAFIWDRPDGLLLVAFPLGAYDTMTITWPRETWATLPTYVGGIIIADLLILFFAYLVYRRRTQRAVMPINEALEALSRGAQAQLDLKGDLGPIADRINETSDILERKDRAREQWIRGVSHDIRTPLSMIIGKAEGIAGDQSVPDTARDDARAIRTQGFKIKDLVADLNAASQLSFSNRPLNLERVHLAKLARSIAATYLNSGLDDTHPLTFELDELCADAVVLGDARMLTRLIENLLANARLHNPEGCSISLTLTSQEHGEVRFARLCVSDDGQGIAPNTLAALHARLARARLAKDDATPDDAGHGLGLVLVDRIARAHDGFLEVSGALGAGFSACALLPLA